MKKVLASILALALTVTMLAACSAASSSDAAPSAGNAVPAGSASAADTPQSGGDTFDPSSDKTVVTVWCRYPEDEEPTKPYQRLLR